MTRQADDAYIVSQVLTAELCAEPDFVSFRQYLFFQFHVAESAAELIARSRQVVVEMGGSQLHRQQVLLGGSSSDNEGYVVGRTCGRAQRLYLFDKERNQCPGIQDSFRLLIEISLVSRTAALGNAKELILHTFGSFDVNLCRKVALRVHFVVHIERGVLGITQVLFRICFVDAEREGFLIAVARPYLLSFFTVDDSRTRVLAERQHAFGGNFGIAQESQSYIFIVVACFGVAQNLGDLLVVRTAQHKRNVAESRISHCGKPFLFDFQDRFSFKLAYGYIVFCKQIILGCIFTLLEHGLILERRCCCHNYLFI